MAKDTLKPRNTDKGWKLDIPASRSDTGVRKRLYFPTRDEATKYAGTIRDAKKEHGEKALIIPPMLAEKAVAAETELSGLHLDILQAAKLVRRLMEKLSPFNSTLEAAVDFYVSKHDLRSKAPTLAEAFDEGIRKRPNHRPRTLSDYRAWKKALPADFLATNVCDIDSDLIEKALSSVTTGATTWKNGLRYISSVLTDCVKAGKIAENPAKRVHVERRPDDAADTSTYSAEELKALFAACRTYDDGMDRQCSDCRLPFALMAFAGIRPDEVSKLEWSDISLELSNIRIGPSVAKRARRRNVRIHPTLGAWLESIPNEKRTGKVCPPRWRYKAARVRKEAGIDGHEKQDALRHSFGTYLLATEGDLNALQSDMGHEHVRVFFEHYHKAVTKSDAAPYWEILPFNGTP